jgi:hypothetical protein
MTLARRVFALAFVCLVAVGAARAADALGVPVYAGARAEAGAAKLITEMMPGAKAFCYTTGDSIEKVAAFYKKQGLTYMGGDAENGMFRKGQIDVTLQRPWMDVKTGKLNPSTLISIVQRPE